MTKVAEAKTAATAAKVNTPFFNKGGDEALSLQTEKERSFFTRKNKIAAIQTKISIGQPNDKYEKEADAVADKVVQRLATPDVSSKNETTVQAKPFSAIITPIHQSTH